MCPILGPKLDAMARAGQLRDRDERPFHASKLKLQRPVEPLGGLEGGDLLAQVGQPRPVGRAVAASGPLHGRLFDLPGEESRRGDRLLGAAVDHCRDRPPPSCGLVKAAKAGRCGLAVHGQRAQAWTS